jgi:hypothetical protein
MPMHLAPGLSAEVRRQFSNVGFHTLHICGPSDILINRASFNKRRFDCYAAVANAGKRNVP